MASTLMSRVNWPTTLFLGGSFLVAAIGTPLYAMQVGLTWFDFIHFMIWVHLTGMSITVGYHRLFSHRAFRANWLVRAATALFGAGAFQNSVLQWSSEHRYHHKYVDRDGYPYDPYNINRGFFFAHVGWLLAHAERPLPQDNVKDLRRDPLLRWQDRHINLIAVVVGLGLPALVGLGHAAWVGGSLGMGALGGFLIGGCLRLVVVQHCTFFINSLCHMIGRRPYDGTQTARDNELLAFFTFGEGYHNYHHTFQHDYRNGVKPWTWDPSKWVIWLLSKIGLVSRLRRVPQETIWMARIHEKRRVLEQKLAGGKGDLSEQFSALLKSQEARLEQAYDSFKVLWAEYSRVAAHKLGPSQKRIRELRVELKAARHEIRAGMRAWLAEYRYLLAMTQATTA